MNFFDRIGITGRCFHAVTGMVVIGMFAQPARADLLELTNGDHYRGTVVSMTASNLEFISEVQGRVTLPRAKIAQITLHEVVGKPVAAKPATNAPLVLSGSSSPPTANANAPVTSQAEVLVQQMRAQGVDPKLVTQVQEQILGKASPEASAKFNELMGGLMSGQLSVKDIRDQAQRGIEQIRAAKKELGPEAGDALDSYLGILEKFVQEASAEVAQTTPAAPSPRK